MNELPFITSPEEFQAELRRMHALRKIGKVKSKRLALSKKTKQAIHAKTGGKCHICSADVLVDNFEADHVRSHTHGGTNLEDNFLPACRTCNNYKWHYLPDEYKWILKIGVWARTQMSRNTSLGNKMAEAFVSHEHRREERRKIPRV